MRKGILKKIVGAGTTAVMIAASIPSVPAVVHGADQQVRGNIGGFDYEMWNQNYTGQASMNPGAGSFSCSWSGIENFLARMGKNYDSKKQRYNQIGSDITLTYDVEYTPRGNSYMCVYGWTRNPLMEYYIVEGWGDWRPPGDGAERKGTVTLDGNTYDIAKTMRYNQPSLDGTATFPQYWSIRQTSGSRNNTTNYMKGTIHVGKHFDAWSKAGLDMSGTLYEVSLNIEGYRSNGSANVKSLAVYENGYNGGGGGGGGETVTPAKTVEPDKNGDYFTNDFESGEGDWVGRGSASVDTNSKNFYDGSKSLYVSGRENEWNGCAIPLDSSAFVPGETYSFSAAVLQNSGSTVTLQMSLQQGDGNGASYTQIADCSAKSGEWTKLENTKFEIPSNSGDLILYIETPESSGDLCDFFVDAVQVSKAGKESSVVTGQGTVGDTSAGGGSGSGGGEGGSGGGASYTGVRAHQNLNYKYEKGGDGFKDYMGPYFRLGTSVSGNEIGNSQAQQFIKKNYNSITCENEMKPDSIVAGVNGDNVNISLNSASSILKFAEQNGIGVRGHTFVWYSQTPQSLFQDNGGTVSKDRMNKRLESMIKNTFSAIKSQFPNLNLHSYDVCNELFVNDGGGMRPANNSNWSRVYNGSSEFVVNAFKYARQYAPKDCKLYLNDYNEYMSAKTKDLVNMAKTVMKEGDYIDGIGMQAHLDSKYPSASEFETAIKQFESLGLDVQITELDITNSTGSNGQLYPQIFEVAMKHAKNISTVTLWGTTDERSWRYRENGGSPLPFSNYQPKSFYNDIIALTKKIDPPSYEEEVVTTTTTTTAPVVTTTTTTVPAKDLKELLNEKVSKWGDGNCDGGIDMADAVIIMQSLANPNKYSLTDQGKFNADVYEAGAGITTIDAYTIQKYLLGLIKSLPDSYADKILTVSSQGSNGGNEQQTVATQPTTTTTTRQTTTTTKATTTTTTTQPKSNFNYNANLQYKAAPDYYFNGCQQQGKVTKESYNGINGYNSCNVYTPYNYDPSKKYNIFYLMHGGGENENTLISQNDTMIQNMLDNMIKNGELEPLIVVFPTFNKTEAGRFYSEFRQSLVPFVEGKYSTYANKDTSESSLKASRMHRAYGGFSMGGVSTWAVFENCLDIVGYFMPLSGDSWNGNSAYDKAKGIANAVDKSGLQKNEYFIFCATGSTDIAYPNVSPQIDEMKKMSQFVYTSDFSKGNLYFMVVNGKDHWWGNVRHYVYDGLPYFFHEGQ
ncbi:MAG: endo-1,4-beta-xylanase [Ruminococcus sp.]|uniref:endo-1,4-beta-xylanase n=1 Tax=Ruminococcus sp. TaxID=41978 RepID=UPI0025FFD793|nr:endo-1,4-beta-xylanase [Ruminococcus sp.]MBR5682828.1 endo-1,4-beta-xylanase [Ruminococcus sp.]